MANLIIDAYITGTKIVSGKNVVDVEYMVSDILKLPGKELKVDLKKAGGGGGKVINLKILLSPDQPSGSSIEGLKDATFVSAGNFVKTKGGKYRNGKAEITGASVDFSGKVMSFKISSGGSGTHTQFSHDYKIRIKNVDYDVDPFIEIDD